MKNKILPVIAVALVIVAVLIIIFIPKNNREDKSVNVGSENPQSTPNTTNDYTKETLAKSTSKLATLDENGTGCHPIMIDESGITKTDTGIIINKDVLLSNEKIFSNIVVH